MREETDWTQALLCGWCVEELHEERAPARANLKPDNGAYRITDMEQFLRTAALGEADPYVSLSNGTVMDPRAVTVVKGSAVCGKKQHLTKARS